MTLSRRGWCGRLTAASIALSSVLVFGQSESPTVLPLRTAPTETLTVNPGFRDWSPTTVAGTTILGGNQTNRGGVVAIDTVSGKVKWTYRPVFTSGTASVSTAPAVSGDMVITPFAAANPGAVIALSLASGKEVWRGPDPAQNAAVAVNGALAYVLGKDGVFHALEAVTGRERWKVAFTTNRAVCASSPIVRGDTIYLTSSAGATPGDAAKPAGYYLFALDANTGQERWRYRAEAPYVHDGVCLRQPVVTSDTIFAAGDNFLYAVHRATGRDRWKPIEVRRPVDGRVRPVEVHGLVDADTAVIGMTSGFLIAFDKNVGQTLWELPGNYNTGSPSTMVAGNILYFQGSPGSNPAAASRGTLHGLDLATHTILWSFKRPTAEPNWPFGSVTPVNGGLWVDSYQALVKLQ
jgi:outer membrane protein assembly factor BamB